MVKNLPALWETWVQSLGGEELLEKGMATYCSILVWRILWTEEPDGLPSMGSQRVGHIEKLSVFLKSRARVHDQSAQGLRLDRKGPLVSHFCVSLCLLFRNKKKKTTVTFLKSKDDIKMPSIFFRNTYNPSSCIIKMTGNLVI